MLGDGRRTCQTPFGLIEIHQSHPQGFHPSLLVNGTEVMSSTEVMTPSLRVMQMQKKEKGKEIFVAERCENLEGLDEKREEA